jgi:chromate reductase, NAD(P)H dehydrogenase (quinone)
MSRNAAHYERQSDRLPGMAQFQVLGIAGSLRQSSYNRALLRAGIELAPPELNIQTYDLLEIPMFNEDVEAKGDPQSVQDFKKAIGEADGLLVATPEYNYGIPGVLKNAIDWASRPPGKSTLYGKPAGIIGASQGSGGTIRAQSTLRLSFVFVEVYAMLKPEFFVANCRDKFDDKGNLTDERTRELLVKFLKSFASWIEVIKSRKR